MKLEALKLEFRRILKLNTRRVEVRGRKLKVGRKNLEAGRRK